MRYPADNQIDVGANDMSRTVQSTAANCPNTRIVLGGYSLGAAVTDVVLAMPFAFFGFDNPLPPEMEQHIAAVALFGNGIQWAGPIGSFNPLYRDRTIELCHGDDPICNPADPTTGSRTGPTTSPRPTSRRAWSTRRPTSSRAGSAAATSVVRASLADLVGRADVAGHPDPRLELIVGRIVDGDEGQAARRRGGEVARSPRRRQQFSAPTGFAAPLAHRQQCADQ